MTAGTAAVETRTAIYYPGIDVFKKVSGEVKQFMEDNGYSKISEMGGIAHR